MYGAQKYEFTKNYVLVDKIIQQTAIDLLEDNQGLNSKRWFDSHFWLWFGTKSERGYNEKKSSTLSPVFLRHYKNTFPNVL